MKLNLFGHKQEKRTENQDELFRLIKLSQENGRKIKLIYMTDFLRKEFAEYFTFKNGKILLLDIEVKFNPDIGVQWEK